VYALDYTDIPMMFFTPHHVGHLAPQGILALLLSKIIVVKQYMPTIYSLPVVAQQ
jgi:hypothetical protein